MNEQQLEKVAQQLGTMFIDYDSIVEYGQWLEDVAKGRLSRYSYLDASFWVDNDYEVVLDCDPIEYTMH